MGLQLAKMACYLTKLAEQVQDVPAHGTEGRLLRVAMPGAKLKKPQGPRAYAPRLNKQLL